MALGVGYFLENIPPGEKDFTWGGGGGGGYVLLHQSWEIKMQL